MAVAKANSEGKAGVTVWAQRVGRRPAAAVAAIGGTTKAIADAVVVALMVADAAESEGAERKASMVEVDAEFAGATDSEAESANREESPSS